MWWTWGRNVIRNWGGLGLDQRTLIEDRPNQYSEASCVFATAGVTPNVIRKLEVSLYLGSKT